MRAHGFYVGSNVTIYHNPSVPSVNPGSAALGSLSDTQDLNTNHGTRFCWSAGKNTVMHKLGRIHAVPDEVDDVTVIHPFRRQRKFVWFQCRTEQR